MAPGNRGTHASTYRADGGDHAATDYGKPMLNPKKSLMSRFTDWWFEHVYLPEKRRIAQERVKQIVEEQNAAYEKLMVELNNIRKEVEDKTHGHD